MKRREKLETGAVIVRQPLVIIYENESNQIITELWPNESCNSPETYALLIADLVGHIARKFQVDPHKVWKVVDLERANPTVELTSREESL